MTNLRIVVLALLVPCCPAEAWLPDAGELRELCSLAQWEERAAPLLAEPDEVIRQWLVNPINGQQDTPLHICALYGSLGLLVQLLSRVPASNRLVLECKDLWGNTLLHLAALRSHLPVVQYLLAQGALVDAKTYAGSTPLLSAARNGHLPVVQCLLAHGARVDAATDDGATPLYWAALRGHLEVVEYLLVHGARVNAAAADGTTPLYWAAINGYQPVVECLLAHGARAGATANYGTTPLHRAYMGSYQEVAQLLRNPSSPNFTPQTLQHLLSFRIWHWVGRHIDRLKAMFADPSYPLPPGLLTVILAQLGFKQLDDRR